MVRVWWMECAPAGNWHMGRELSIWNRLVKLDDPELVNGAMEMLPTIAPDVRRPFSLKLFYGRNSTPLYERCKAEWLKSQTVTTLPRGSGLERARFSA